MQLGLIGSDGLRSCLAMAHQIISYQSASSSSLSEKEKKKEKEKVTKFAAAWIQILSLNHFLVSITQVIARVPTFWYIWIIIFSASII
jgi:hypothetical protein